LTRQDYKDLDNARRAGMTGAQLVQEVQQRQNANILLQRQYQADVRQAQNDALTQQRQAEELQLRRDEAQRQEAARAEAAAKAKREAAEAADPIQGKDDKANADRTLFKYRDAMRDGTATQEQRDLYAQAAQYYLKPTMQWVQDPSDPT